MATTSQETFTNDIREEWETIPDRLLDDGLVKFFRARYSIRKKLISTFDEHETNRVNSELDRINRLRENFRFNESHKSDMNDLGSSLAKWKQAARTDVEERMMRLKSQINELQQGANMDRQVSSEHRSNLEDKQNKYQQLESLLSKLIPNVDKEPEPSKAAQPPRCSSPIHQTNSQLDSDFGFTVSTITLEKESLSGSFTKFSMEKFDLNEVLHDRESTEKDPLKEKPKPNSIRYFHFPANNMTWVGQAPNISKATALMGDFFEV